MRCLAIDIGGTKIASAIVENENITERKQITTPQHEASQAMHQTLEQIVKNYQGKFDYIAVASTGIIRGGILTALNPKNLGGLAEFPLKESLKRHTNKPIGLLNDAAAATYAEYQFTDRSEIENFIFITVSTGVGGGLIINRKLITKPYGVAGHIGHSLADPNGPYCGCGRQGCVEALASGRAIEAEASKWDEPCLPKEVFERFHQKDPKAIELVNKSASAIANLVADMKIGLDVQKIAIGGSVGLASGYIETVQEHLHKMPQYYHCPIIKAKSGADAGLLGTAWWVRDCIQNNFDF